jgi:sulfur-oxidizing protein SoxY
MLGTAGYLMSSKIVFAGKEQVLKRIDEITKGKGAKELDIFLDLPEIAENGNQVKVNFEIESEMTEENYIKNVYILADGNPAPDVAKFSFTPDMGICSATTRIRLSKTQNVVLVAENNKNEYFMTKSKVKVTIGGCGG